MWGRIGTVLTGVPALIVLALSPGARCENVDPDLDGSRYAYGENVGWINAEPSGDGGPGIHVADFELTGWMWSENLGWISLSCKNTGSCSTVTYGVSNQCDGALSGHAWAENAGWIVFDPTLGGVTVDTAGGDFHGFAWGENFGWIGFNCADTASCTSASFKVTTAWTPSTAAPAGSTTVMAGASGADTLLTWDVLPGAAGYDMVRGDLAALRSGRGDFAAATVQCLDDDRTTNSLSFAGMPAEGQGFWFLVRGANCGGGGTYDSGVGSQVAARDAGIAASGNACN